jgi:hypothetical protein
MIGLRANAPNARLAGQEPDSLQDLMGGHTLAKGKDILAGKQRMKLWPEPLNIDRVIQLALTVQRNIFEAQGAQADHTGMVGTNRMDAPVGVQQGI